MTTLPQRGGNLYARLYNGESTRIITVVLILFSVATHAQVDMSQKEQLEKQRETDRKQDALRDSALAPNEKPLTTTPVKFDTDSGATFDVDHSSLGYTMLLEKDNVAHGIKFSGAFTVAILNEQKQEKNPVSWLVSSCLLRSRCHYGI